ncbi:MAG: hypothetical protein H7345_00480 [Rubritepida sp.]|nr:hypothetical protein [Rubritepida sp.]
MPTQSLIEPPKAALTRRVGSNCDCVGSDVVWVKASLCLLGRYHAPFGLSPVADRGLFDAIMAYQRDRGLVVDGHADPLGETESTLRVEIPRVLQGAKA